MPRHEQSDTAVRNSSTADASARLSLDGLAGSPREALQILRQEFRRVDTDHNGFVTANEISAYAQTAGNTGTPQEKAAAALLQSKFATAVKDVNSVNFNDFCPWTHKKYIKELLPQIQQVGNDVSHPERNTTNPFDPVRPHGRPPAGSLSGRALANASFAVDDQAQARCHDEVSSTNSERWDKSVIGSIARETPLAAGVAVGIGSMVGSMWLVGAVAGSEAVGMLSIYTGVPPLVGGMAGTITYSGGQWVSDKVRNLTGNSDEQAMQRHTKTVQRLRGEFISGLK